MDILISVAAKIAEYTVAPIGRQVGYLIFYKAKFKELRDCVSDLEYKRDEIKQRVEKERRNGKTTSDVVQNWLKNVDEAIGDVTQLQNDPRHEKAGCSRWSFPNVVTRHQLSRKATKVAKKVVEVRGGGDFFQVAYRPKLDAVSAFTIRSSQNLESRKPIIENIMHALRDAKVSMVGIYGLGGVGKTTLVEEVYQIAKENQLFDEVVMATISKTPDIKTVQEEIADQLGLRFEEVTVAGRAPRLYERIKMEKTILLILDDIWEALDLKKVGIPSDGEHNGCKLLMTSRTLDLLRQMGVKEHFRLEILNEEESWSLFQSKANNLDKEPDKHQIAFQLAKKCAGLPILIVTMARSLIDQNIHAWKDALSQLEKVDNEELQEITYSALELSYKRLKGNEMKAFFLLCATNGKNLSVNDLFKYGMGLGIFNSTNTMEGARNRLHNMISALKASCLLLEDNTSTRVKMHDVVREVAISIAYRDYHILVKYGDKLREFPKMDILSNCSQIILLNGAFRQLPEKLDGHNLKFFHLSNFDLSLEIPNFFFAETKFLQVLDLTGLNLTSLPTSFLSLTNLKTLCLDLCVLENIDAVGALKNLEILSLLKSSMIKLSSEIGKLSHLRMLDLSDSGIEIIPAGVISSLIKLEELYMGNTSIKWKIENSDIQDENASLDELRQLSNLTTLELQIQEAWMLPRDLMFHKLERFKIVIGDVWEWDDIADVTLKTLKLKLGTNIHLEHGIKSLIRSAENLYLDEVEGISNVLYQLNGDGFPQLKHLHIQNNALIQHIIDFTERSHIPTPFPNLEKLVIQNLGKMEKICHGPLAVGFFAKLRAIKVEKCNKVKYFLSVSMVKGMPQLSELEISECNLMEKVVFEDDDASAMNDETGETIQFPLLHSLTLQHLDALESLYSHQPTSSPISLFNNQVAFPNLDTLKLSSLSLNKIWKDNRHCFYKLRNLIVENCDGLKYLFSSAMVDSFSSLIKLEISECHLMEEIIAVEEDSENNIVTLKEVRFSKLQTVILKNMKSLKKIWHKEFSKVKSLEVKNCEKIRAIFSSSMQKAYNDLETLMVTDCVLVEEIFQLSSDENYSTEQTQLKKITLERLWKLKQIWSKDPERALNFCNLEEINVENCINLEFVFPCSVATSCSHLKELTIKWCQYMKEIIGFKEEPMFSSISFEFNHLNTLVLWYLHKLKGFYARNYTLSCPSLRNLDITGCVKLNLYRTLSTSSHQKLSDEEYIISIQQHLVAEQVMPNLEHLRIDEKDAANILQTQNIGSFFNKISFLALSRYKTEGSAFPDQVLQNICSLKLLNVEWSSFKKIFQDKRLTNEKNCTKLQSLRLHQLANLQQICEEGLQIDPVLELLEYLHVDGCLSLINIVPSSVTFRHLTYLEVANCNSIINLLSPHTARSLAKLTVMKVKQCDSLEEILSKEGEEITNDIAFFSLETLELDSLPRLGRFCSQKCFLRFPLLRKVVVRECARMKYFSEGDRVSTPKLRKVLTAENSKQFYWKGDLNGTIKNMFEDKVCFCSFENLNLSKYPELKELWYDRLQNNIFSKLKKLLVHKCDFLSDVLFSPNIIGLLVNLEELDVKDCNSLVAVFHISTFSEEIETRKCSFLRKLTLCSLPNLKHIWKEDPNTTMSFQNLCEVSVVDCLCLKSLFPYSVATNMARLEDLEVSNCGIVEVVDNQRWPREMIKFVFPHLRKLWLINLLNLRTFISGIYSLQCKSLKDLCVFNCPRLKLFQDTCLSCQERAMNDKISIPIHQPLLKVEEVLPNLKVLGVNNNNVEVILQSMYSQDQYDKLEHLSVSLSESEVTTFPYWFLENAQNLESLNVGWSSFVEIFHDQSIAIEEGQVTISTRLKDLKLAQLHDLRHICKEGFQIDPALQHLEQLAVGHCSSLVNLVPSSVTFAYLKHLEVANCDGMINLITCSTAKSLVNLATMKIESCNLLQDIMNANENEKDKEIAFSSLETLELVSLPRLRSFCSCKCSLLFPLLENVLVKECPRMEIFSTGDTSTPDLQQVQIEENNKQNFWEGDLNGTINKLFDDKVSFCRFRHLTLSDYPELRDFWYDKEYHNLFGNLKSLVVQKCEFLSDVLFTSNTLQVLHELEELEVRNCDSLVTLFDVKEMKSNGAMVKQASKLKKLSLSSLLKLRHIWNAAPCEIVSFENLCTVDVVECKSLLYLFPPSICLDLPYIEKLNIVSCGVENIVSMEKESTEITFSFPHLSFLGFFRLEKLKSFYLGRFTLECPSLKTLNVYHCEALQMFTFNHSSLQQHHQIEEINDSPPIPQALFSIEKLSGNSLEQLALNGKDAMMMINGHMKEAKFSKVELLRMQCLYDTQLICWNDLLEIFPNVVTLHVRQSSVQTLFPVEESAHCSTRIAQQVRTLELFEMEHLKHIWPEESLSDQLAPQNLESLRVAACPNMVSVVSSSVSFQSLKELYVENCKGMTHLITYSIAKSLMQLEKLIVRNCEMIKDVVNVDEEEAEEDIIFENLEYLELSTLISLRSFCYAKHALIFPSLIWFIVKACPQMEVFSPGSIIAPSLRRVEVENKRKRWKGDLNTTIEQLFKENQEVSHSNEN
ncbi:hypothetical protein HN51_052376 [Arachis hypogaea]|uniref:uncharacterized protein isoform X1 n=1 Tax=Arachis hypogaea TaxID=3818 RepID=UPI001105712B|nr:uncharacterized protein LOC112764942 isoform X1 [Arachis hypogaea]QHN93715.1 Disease resistance protein [Arachis hypogaea]